MGMFDQAARFATKAEPDFVLTRLRPLTGLTLAFRGWFDPKAIPLPGGADRQPDLVAVADEPDPTKPAWLLIFEIQAQHDQEKPKVVLLEAATFFVYARDVDREGVPLLPLPVFVYLRGKIPAGGAVAVRTPSGHGFGSDPVPWEVGEDSAASALAKVVAGEYSWGALFWSALMKGAEKHDVIDLWVKLRDEKVPQLMRASVTHVAVTFAELAGCRLAWNRVVGGIDMTESALFEELVEVVRLRDAREALLRVVRGRFPTAVTPDVERAIADQPSLALLRQWLDAAATSATADDFLAVLRR